NLIAPWYRKAPGLVLICSPQFLLRKYYGLINVEQAPTEQVAVKMLAAQKEIGGLTPITPPFFPDDAFLITSLSNLSPSPPPPRGATRRPGAAAVTSRSPPRSTRSRPSSPPTTRTRSKTPTAPCSSRTSTSRKPRAMPPPMQRHRLAAEAATRAQRVASGYGA